MATVRAQDESAAAEVFDRFGFSKGPVRKVDSIGDVGSFHVPDHLARSNQERS